MEPIRRFWAATLPSGLKIECASQEEAQAYVVTGGTIAPSEYADDNWAHEALLLMDQADSLVRFCSTHAPEPRYTPAAKAFWEACRLLAAERVRLHAQAQPEFLDLDEVNMPRKEKTTELQALKSWSRLVRFGNLVKDDGVNALNWYTVELWTPQAEVYTFDAAALADKVHGRDAGFQFSEDIGTAVRQAQELAEKAFPDYFDFSSWVKQHFYTL